MIIQQTPTFARAAKKLAANSKAELNLAIRTIRDNPLLGHLKKGDLNEVRVYKFRMNKQETLIAYSYLEASATISLLALAPHENFYRDLKRNVV